MVSSSQEEPEYEDVKTGIEELPRSHIQWNILNFMFQFVPPNQIGLF